jgi:hypothetical protein
MTDNAEYGIITTGNKEDRLKTRRIPKIVAEIGGMHQTIVSYTISTTTL